MSIEAALSTDAEPVALYRSSENGNSWLQWLKSPDAFPDGTALYAEPVKTAPAVAVKALKAWEAWEAKLILEGSDDLWDELGDLTDLQALRNAALSAQVQYVTGWRPIETAPKDGTHFIAYEIGDVYRCFWKAGALDDDIDGAGWFDDAASSYENPTHWMPLPAAPAKQEGKP